MDEGPVVFGLAGAHAGVEGRVGAGGQAGECGWGRNRGLEGPAIRALDALTFARVTGVSAPTAARLVQTLTTCSVPRAVLRCSKTHNTSPVINQCRTFITVKSDIITVDKKANILSF